MKKQRQQIRLEPEQKKRLKAESDRSGVPQSEIMRRALDSWLEESDWWDEISEAEKAGIRRAQKDIEAGRVTPHKEVRKTYEKWL